MQLLKYLFVAELATALPHFVGELDDRSIKGYNPYEHWGPDDSRSPCPGLNTLANHNYLPHDGRNISRADIIKASQDVFNFSPELTSLLNDANFLAIGDPATVDLSDFGAPALSEHRGSLTRFDAEDDYTVYPVPELVDQVLSDSDDCEVISVHSLAKSRLRIAEMTGLTGGPLSPNDSDAGSGTSALILLTLPTDLNWDLSAEGFQPTTPKSWAETWLKKERLPLKQGWRKPGHVATVPDLVTFKDMIDDAKKNITGSS